MVNRIEETMTAMNAYAARKYGPIKAKCREKLEGCSEQEKYEAVAWGGALMRTTSVLQQIGIVRQFND